MKCKSWSNKLNLFVVRKLKSIKTNGQQQVLNSSTMPAMPKEKTSPLAALPRNESSYTDLKMKDQMGATAVITANMSMHQRTCNAICGCGQQSLAAANNVNQQTVKNNMFNNTQATKLLLQKAATNTNGSSSSCCATATTNSLTTTAATTTTTVVNTTTGKMNSPPAARTPPKKTPKDYIFGKFIGEGSFSTVYLAFDIHCNKEFAIKVCDKQHIVRENKQQYIRREREVMHVMSNTPGFVSLTCTFQDYTRLYFVMTYAKNGDLLPYINKAGSFDMECARFYAAELLLSCENMDRNGIVHRDLKPENILLDENMHTLVADFGSAKILGDAEPMAEVDSNGSGGEPPLLAAVSGGEGSGNSSSDDNLYESYYPRRRKVSFVGTAQYVSPEVLQNQNVSRTTDLWALGCIIYQMISGLPPFRGRTDYFVFKEILSGRIVFPEEFNKDAEDLVRSLLRLNPEERLGADDRTGRYESIRSHPFFDGIDWENIRTQTPPQIYPYMESGVSIADEEYRNQFRVPRNLEPGLNDRQITRLLGLELGTSIGLDENLLLEENIMALDDRNYYNLSEKEKNKFLTMQKSDKWHKFADNEVIIKKGFVNKRKGLFSRKRMFLLTTGPRLIYIDPVNMVKKGEIPWSREMKVEPKNFKIFFVHTPNRTYYLEDPEGYALEWVDAIETARREAYSDQSS